MKKQAIGVFDSGVGGLTVLKSLMQCCPHERYIYLGDTARVPYGTKGSDTVRRYAKECAQFLMSHNVKMMVVACNTVSSVAIDDLKKFFPVPIIGVVNPAAKEALNLSKTKTIGIIGTKRTINSESYLKALRELDQSVNVLSQACPLFVPLVEEGWNQDEIAAAIVKRYLESMRKSNVDTIILGCTHYPLLKDLIQKDVGADVSLIECGMATAKDVEQYVDKVDSDSSIKTEASYYVTDDAKGFETIASLFMKEQKIKAQKIDL